MDKCIQMDTDILCSKGRAYWRTEWLTLYVPSFDQSSKIGNVNPRAKLAPEQIREIRKLKGHMSHSKIGIIYGVATATITRLLAGESWIGV